MQSEWAEAPAYQAALALMLKEKPPPTQQRVVAVAKLAVENRQYYKHVVHATERFIAKIADKSPQHLLGAAYIVDAICRRSQTKFGDKDRFGARFAANLADTLANLRRCPAADLPALDRVLQLWRDNNVIVAAGRRGGSPPATASAKRARVAPPQTPPGSPGPANMRPHYNNNNNNSNSNHNNHGNDNAGALGGAPPMLPPPPSYAAAEFVPSLAASSQGPPPMITMDFDYEDEQPVLSEAAINDAKRRRLEQERRANEVAPPPVAHSAPAPPSASLVPPEIMAQVVALLDQPQKLQLVLESAGLTLADLVALLQTAPEASGIVAQLTRGLGGGAGPVRPPEEVLDGQGRPCTVRMSATVYVGQLAPAVVEDDLRRLFQNFGPITHVSCRPGQGHGFVTFADRDSAERARNELDNFPLYDQQIRLGWARGPDMRDCDFDKRSGRGLLPKLAPGQHGGGGGGGGGGGYQAHGAPHHKQQQQHYPPQQSQHHYAQPHQQQSHQYPPHQQQQQQQWQQSHMQQPHQQPQFQPQQPLQQPPAAYNPAMGSDDAPVRPSPYTAGAGARPLIKGIDF